MRFEAVWPTHTLRKRVCRYLVIGSYKLYYLLLPASAARKRSTNGRLRVQHLLAPRNSTSLSMHTRVLLGEEEFYRLLPVSRVNTLVTKRDLTWKGHTEFCDLAQEMSKLQRQSMQKRRNSPELQSFSNCS